MNPVISFLVVSFNSEKYIEACLNSILRQTEENFEIIAIDNNSTDNTAHVLQGFKKHPLAQIILNSKNLGYGEALNIGITRSRGDYIVVLNADVVLDEQWASNLLELFLNDEKIMAATGQILFPNGEVQSTGGLMDKYGAVIQRGSSLFKTSKMTDRADFFYCDGSSIMIRRKILDQIRFDPTIFLYYEDVDLSWRIRRQSYNIGYSEKAISYHQMGHSNSDMTLDKFYHIAKNRIYVCLKNYSSRNIVTRVPVLLFLVFLDSIYYDKSKKPRGYIKTFFRALGWNVSNLGHIREKRRNSKPVCKISDSELDKYLLNASIESALLKSGR